MSTKDHFTGTHEDFTSLTAEQLVRVFNGEKIKSVTFVEGDNVVDKRNKDKSCDE